MATTRQPPGNHAKWQQVADMHRPPTVGADALGQRVETKTSNPLFAISTRPGKTGKDVAGVKGEVPVAISL